MTTVNIHEAKTHLSRLVDEVAAGAEIIIAKAGKPMARLTPILPPVRKKHLGLALSARRTLLDNVASRGYIDRMKTVGVRELKNHLSEYLRQVRLGESVLVTDRGEVVAEFSPPTRGLADPSLPAGLLALAKRGLATLGTPASEQSDLYQALPRSRRNRRSAAQLLDEERGSR